MWRRPEDASKIKTVSKEEERKIKNIIIKEALKDHMGVLLQTHGKAGADGRILLDQKVQITNRNVADMVWLEYRNESP